MSGQTLFLIFFGGLFPLMYLGFILGRNKSSKIREAGKSMHSQPDQYGWFVAVYTGLPAILLASVISFVSLFGIEVIPPVMLVGAALALAAFALLFFHSKVKPETKARNLNEGFVKGLLIFAAGISILTTFGILFSILFEALHFFSMQSVWYFLFGTQWFPEGEPAKFGAVPLFAGTFYITFIAMAIAVPIGLLSAIYMSEYASEKTRNYVKPMLEILAGIPTVVYGFFAAVTVAPLLVRLFDLLGLQASFQNALAPGIVMGVMIIPIISSLSDPSQVRPLPT